MKNTKPLPSKEFLNECFTYDPLTGDVFWKERPRHHFVSQRAWSVFNAKYAGAKAGSKAYTKDGKPMLIEIGVSSISGRLRLLSHRVIHGIMGLEIPDGYEVDHSDLDPFNNRWINLRLATPSQNIANQSRRSGRSDKSLPKGVYRDRHKFMAQVSLNGKTFCLGTFFTPEEAHEAYCVKRKELYGEFSRTN